MFERGREMDFLEKINHYSLRYEIETQFVNETHIAKGWLSWLNDSETMLHTNSLNRQYTAADLSDFLRNDTSIFFLACSKNSIYFGNLRIYEYPDNAASFGRLIGKASTRNEGLGTKLSMLAQDIIFNVLDYEDIIVSNKINNLASRYSKLKSGFTKMGEKKLSFYGLEAKPDEEFFIKTKEEYLNSLIRKNRSIEEM